VMFCRKDALLTVTLMRPRKIPVYPIADYSDSMTRDTGIFVGTIEESIAQRPNRLAIHRHDYFELYLLEGEGEHFNDFETYAIETPSIVCVSPGQVHFWKQAATLQGPMICFTQEFVEKHAPSGYSLLHHPFWYPIANPPIITVSTDQAGEARSLIEEMQREFIARKAGVEQILGLLLQALLLRINRIYPLQNAQISSRSETHLLRTFLLALEQNFRTVTSITGYAELLRVNPEALTGAVKQQTGRTAGTFIRQRILLEAQRLLLHTSLTVSEIAYGVGFEDPSYFIRFFRRLTGKTPSAFRDQCHLKYSA
jgi:AraC family transcriptional activator of pobA